MILNRTYYLVKPLMPWRVRILLRRWRAERLRFASNGTWPIDEAAGATPSDWPGWPHGKQFGFVLTHDVEGAKGYDRVSQLMEVERKHGFRSSFNFVPRGEYSLSDRMRIEIEEAGFEVGVHGLEHDGKLYSSQTQFSQKAAEIRSYLEKWEAVGFRSPFMQHRLEWLHELGAEYDASTFDTDPFEPEPDGAGTIFPFWVDAPNGGGYVELPYTLVQDFTLFVILRETTIDLWKKKVDWIVSRGGMVLVNVHPDYIAFQGAPGRDEFPVALYEEFLTYVKEKYAGQYWSSLPRDVARYFRSTMVESARTIRSESARSMHRPS